MCLVFATVVFKSNDEWWCLPFQSLWPLGLKKKKKKKEITGLKMIPEWFVSPKSYNTSLPGDWNYVIWLRNDIISHCEGKKQRRRHVGV